MGLYTKSIFGNKCPRCLHGDVFAHKNPYKLKHMMRMNHSCSQCGESFKREPSFYFGAAFFSYAIQVAIVVGVFVLSRMLVDDPDVDNMIFISISLVILLMPLTFRVSRLMWLGLFVKLNKDLYKQMKQKSPE